MLSMETMAVNCDSHTQDVNVWFGNLRALSATACSSSNLKWTLKDYLLTRERLVGGTIEKLIKFGTVKCFIYRRVINDMYSVL